MVPPVRVRTHAAHACARTHTMFLFACLLACPPREPITANELAAGEVTLTGKVLPIGGVKEKTLAARRAGVKHLVFPEGNRRDWEELTEVGGFEGSGRVFGGGE